MAAQVLFNLGLGRDAIRAETYNLLGVKGCEIDSCRICVNYGMCHVTQTIEENVGSLKALFDTEGAKQMMKEVHELFGPNCKRYEKEEK